MMYYLASIGTGLVFFCLLWLGFNPATPTRLIVYGGLAIGLVLLVVPKLDKLRDSYGE